MQDDFPFGRMNDMLHIDNYKSKNTWNEILLKDCMSESKLRQMLNKELLNTELKQYEYTPTTIEKHAVCFKMYTFNICEYLYHHY